MLVAVPLLIYEKPKVWEGVVLGFNLLEQNLNASSVPMPPEWATARDEAIAALARRAELAASPAYAQVNASGTTGVQQSGVPLSVMDIAARLHCTRSNVRDLIARRRLPAAKFRGKWRVDALDLAAFERQRSA